MESFEGIYFDLSKLSGKARLAESGLGWKPSGGGDTFTLDREQIAQAQWSRAAKGYELKIFTRSSGVSQFDGFQQDDYDRVSKAMKVWYGVNLDQKEHALRGWNWGKAEFGRSELSFNVQNRPAFEIPYTEIANTNLAGRNEVAVDFLPSAEIDDTNEENGTTTGKKGKKTKRRLGGGKDQLVEARFYIPGTVAKKEKKEEDDVKKEDGEEADADGEEEDEADGEEANAANTWYEMLIDKAEIGDVAGDTFASFLDILHLTPRGRFDLDMYEKSFRLRGKTYDYKIQYDAIKKFFLLPKPDDVHTLITIGLDPPLRQGQTRYPFVVMQFKREDDIELDLNMSAEELQEKYQDKLQEHYTGPMYIVLTHLFRGLAGKKVISPSKDFVSRHGQSGIKCSIKANEGHLYCMDKSFMFVPKPATYVAFDNVSLVTMSRVGGAVSASRTFDITVALKQGGEHQFSNINREEQQPLHDFLKAKSIKVRNEMAEESKLLEAALKDQALSDSDEEVVPGGAPRGSADEDSEEADEDFQEGSESDPEEEYNSDVQGDSDAGGSDAEMADADGDDAGDDDDGEEEVSEVAKPPPKKKAKTTK